MVEIPEKIDFKKQYKAYYSPKPNQPEIIKIPDFLFVMVDGQGDPNSSAEFDVAVGALYNVSYTLKFAQKKIGKDPDYSVGPLEALWWCEEGKTMETAERKDWLWTLMIMQPVLISPGEFETALYEAQHKKPMNFETGRVRIEAFDEGEVVQILRIGSYNSEKPDIDKMHMFAQEQGYEIAGKHHEIYLNDPRKVAPDKIKTILRIGVSEPLSPDIWAY